MLNLFPVTSILVGVNLPFKTARVAGSGVDVAVKQIQTGDTNTVFATGEGSLTAEQRLNAFLNYLLTYGRDEFSCYRKIRW